MLIYGSGFIALVGLLVYVLVKDNPKVEQIGLVMFLAGMIGVCVSIPSWFGLGPAIIQYRR